MNSRRNFLRFLGLAPIVGSGAVLAHARKSDEPIELPKGPFHQPYGDIVFKRLDNECGISVGQDNHLWIRVDGKWKRIITE